MGMARVWRHFDDRENHHDSFSNCETTSRRCGHCLNLTFDSGQAQYAEHCLICTGTHREGRSDRDMRDTRDVIRELERLDALITRLPNHKNAGVWAAIARALRWAMNDETEPPSEAWRP